MAADGQRNGYLELQRALPAADSAIAYAVAALIVAFTSLIKPPLDVWAGEPIPPYITFYPAVVLASLCGGPRVGVAVAAVTLFIAWYFWLPTFNSFAIVGAGTPLTLGIFAVNALLLAWVVGVARLMLDRAAAGEAERTLAARESVHRTKNLIAVVHAIASKSAREVETVEQYKEVLSQRLAALNVAQNALVREDWSDVPLAQIIDDAIAPFLPNPSLSIEPGPDADVPERYVNGLCLALYELCTNAMKYGALANGNGCAKLTWRTDNGNCVLEWREERRSGGKVEGSGFGTMLIKTALSRDADTRVDYEFTATEVIAKFRWPTR